MKEFKNYIILGLIGIIGIMYFLKGCSNSKEFDKPKDVISFIKGRVDTIKIPDKQIVYKTIYLPKEIIKWKTNTSDSIISKEMNEYVDSVKSNDNIINYKVITLGKLISLDLTSKLLNRSVLREIDTLKIVHTDVQYKPNSWSCYAGIDLRASRTLLNPSGYITLNHIKSSLTVSYAPLNQEIGVGIGILIFKSKH